MNKIVILPIMFLLAISVFIPVLAEPTESDSSHFSVLPNRNYGIAVNIHLAESIEYDSLQVVVDVDEVQPVYEPNIEVGTNEREEGIIFTEPTPFGYEAKPDTICAVRVRVYLNNIILYGVAVIEINDYGTVSSPIKADLVAYPN